jgi:hypothetical protein
MKPLLLAADRGIIDFETIDDNFHNALKIRYFYFIPRFLALVYIFPYIIQSTMKNNWGFTTLFQNSFTLALRYFPFCFAIQRKKTGKTYKIHECCDTGNIIKTQ